MSKKDEDISLPGVLKQIETGTQAYRDAAGELTNRVVKFEEWLSRLPGRVPATVWELEDDASDTYFNLGLQRDGKQWKLRYWLDNPYDEESWGAGDLRDASIETKIRAMAMFPRLLGAIRDSQMEFVKRSAEAAAEFDKFAQLVGIDDTSSQAKASKGGA